jgi:very-short-patch-repair endonuclease
MAKNVGFYNTASPDRYLLLKEFAHKNKQFATEAESLMWEHLRARQLAVKFNRQHIIGDYIVDFVCIEKKLIIEVDGGYHSEYEQIEKDEFRTQRLNELGFSVIRFKNEEVLGDISNVLKKIKSKLNETAK